MPLTNRNTRAAAIGTMRPFMGIVWPSPSVLYGSQTDRQQMGYSYNGVQGGFPFPPDTGQRPRATRYRYAYQLTDRH
jgi:hypothetical protein